MATEYGMRLRAARKYAGLTQEQLGQKTGIAQSTISSAEREGQGSAETPAYAQACGVSALWLAKGEGPMVPVPQAVKDVDQAITEGRATVIPMGQTTVRRWAPHDPERLVRQFEALLLKLPDANRLAAAQAAYSAMMPYILDLPTPEQEPPGR